MTLSPFGSTRTTSKDGAMASARASAWRPAPPAALGRLRRRRRRLAQAEPGAGAPDRAARRDRQPVAAASRLRSYLRLSGRVNVSQLQHAEEATTTAIAAAPIMAISPCPAAGFHVCP